MGRRVIVELNESETPNVLTAMTVGARELTSPAPLDVPGFQRDVSYPPVPVPQPQEARA